MLNFPSDLTHSHHVPRKDSNYDLYFTNGRKGPQTEFSEESERNTPPSLAVLVNSLLQSLLEWPLKGREPMITSTNPSPRQVVWASVGVALEVRRPSALSLASTHPGSACPSSQCRAQMMRHLSPSLQPSLLPTLLPETGPCGREQLHSVELIAWLIVSFLC